MNIRLFNVDEGTAMAHITNTLYVATCIPVYLFKLSVFRPQSPVFIVNSDELPYIQPLKLYKSELSSTSLFSRV